MGKYFDNMKLAMNTLAKNPHVFFLGQAVGYDGTAMSGTLKDIPIERRLELPVNEDLQMGISIGLSLKGIIPVSIYPRWNFLLLATNQLVNHLDKLNEMHAKDENTKGVIIRVGVGSQRPLHPQHQHIGDYKIAFNDMLDSIMIFDCTGVNTVMIYEQALQRAEVGLSSIVSEYGDFYGEK